MYQRKLNWTKFLPLLKFLVWGRSDGNHFFYDGWLWNYLDCVHYIFFKFKFLHSFHYALRKFLSEKQVHLTSKTIFKRPGHISTANAYDLGERGVLLQRQIKTKSLWNAFVQIYCDNAFWKCIQSIESKGFKEKINVFSGDI